MKRNFLYDRKGATAIEYAIICLVLVLALLGGLNLLATNSQNKWNDTSGRVSHALK